GGQTMNPSIEALLNAVRAANADSVIILPNNGNVIMTALEVDALAPEVAVRVVPTRSLPQGITALLALDPGGDLASNCARREEAIGGVVTVEITHAVRDSTADGQDIHEGDVIAVVADSTSDILPSEAAALGIRVVPLTVRFGEEQFRDGVDLDADAFYARLARGGISPTTSQPSPEDFAAVYRELLREPGDRVLSIHI